MISNLDEVHLDRVLSPEKFIPVSPKELLTIEQRPRRLCWPCFERNLAGVVTYSEELSSQLFNAVHKSRSGKFHELLGFPEDAVSYLGEAYFEDGAQTVSVFSTVIIDLARVPA